MCRLGAIGWYLSSVETCVRSKTVRTRTEFVRCINILLCRWWDGPQLIPLWVEKSGRIFFRDLTTTRQWLWLKSQRNSTPKGLSLLHYLSLSTIAWKKEPRAIFVSHVWASELSICREPFLVAVSFFAILRARVWTGKGDREEREREQKLWDQNVWFWDGRAHVPVLCKWR